MRESVTIEFATGGRDKEIIRRRRDGSIPRIVQSLDPTAIKPPPPIDPNGSGGRVFEARRLVRCSRQAMELIAGLTDGHWGRIECGFRGLTNIFTILKLINAFAEAGADVTMDWLVLGRGAGPSLNEKFWKRYPKERPGYREPPPEEPDAMPIPPVPKSRRSRPR